VSGAEVSKSAKRVSIRDVAREAGVSHTTVSLILNGKLNASPETRERVLSVAARLNYQPDRYFQQAVKERMRHERGEEGGPRVKTKILGLLVPENIYESIQFNDGYYSGVFSGVCSAAAEKGWNILLIPEPKNACGIPQVVLEEKVDGLLIDGPGYAERMEMLCNVIPVAFINTYYPSCEAISVTPHWVQAGDRIMEYAIACGHRNFVFFQHDIPSENLRQVNLGLEGAMQRHGLQLVHPHLSRPRPIREHNTEEQVEEFVREWEAANPRPTMIITTDYYGSVILNALKKHGYSVPEDVSIIGRQGTTFSHRSDPPLTTVVYPVYEIGKLGARLLIEGLEKGKIQPTHTMLRCELLEQSSVKKLI